MYCISINSFGLVLLKKIYPLESFALICKHLVVCKELQVLFTDPYNYPYNVQIIQLLHAPSERRMWRLQKLQLSCELIVHDINSWASPRSSEAIFP